MTDTPMSEPAWLLRMENATAAGGYHCSGFVANETARDYRRLQSLVDELGDVIHKTYVAQQRHRCVCMDCKFIRDLLIRAGKLNEEDVVR